MSGRRGKTSWRRVVAIALATIISCAIGWFFQPLISKNANAVNAVVTIFSILAGFLIAVITLTAEPVIKQAKDWRELAFMQRVVENRLLRHKILFFLYLVTLGCALATFLAPDSASGLRLWLERAFLTLATFVFLLSFTLPGSLMQIQMDRYKAEMKSRMPEEMRRAVELGEDLLRRGDAKPKSEN